MYLIASKAGFVSGKALARKLGLLFHSNIHKIRPDSDVVIRYGNYGTSDRVSEDTEINSVETIRTISAKHKLREILEPEGILTPKYYPYTGSIPEELRDEFPLLSRRRYHRSGKDIIILDDIETPINIGETEFLVKYYETSREYRVHVIDGEVVKIFRKTSEDDYPVKIRTSHYGWGYRRAKLSKIYASDSLEEVCIKSARAVDAYFCGIDIGWSKQLGRWIVFEINSAPSLNSRTLEIYAEKLKGLGNAHDRTRKNSSRIRTNN